MNAGLAFALVLIAAACAGDEPAKAKPAAVPASDKAPIAPAPAAPAATEPTAIICCEFGAVRGTSTQALCDESKGKVVAIDQCPAVR